MNQINWNVWRMVLRKSLMKRAHMALSIAVAATLAFPWAAFADDIVAEDSLTSAVVTTLSFGSVCANSTTTKSVALAINATGHPGSGNNVYANNASVTVSTTSATGTGLSADGGSPYPRTVGTITLPGDWTSKPNQTKSNTVTSSVTLVAGAVAGPFSGTVNYSASGKRSSDGATLTKTLTPGLAVTATVVTGGPNCDNTPPVLSLPGNIIEEATSSAGAVVSFNATASDANPAHPTVTCSPASGSTFPLGTTTVSCSAKDAAGNTATGSFTVTVRDTTPPSVGSPASITAEATSAAGAVVTYTTPTATDTVGPASPAVSCSPASGSTFPLGTTTVTCSATDTAGNTGSSTFTITVQDTTAPVLSLPAPVAEATGPAGAVVTYIATASDVVDGPLTPTCSPPSGSTFALGATTVNCSATDAAHNTATGSFTVTVRDTTPPTISNVPGPITAEATSGSGAAVTYSLPTASDLVDGTVGVTCSPASGSTFALGATTVNCSAKDAAGNTAGASFTVTVVDTTPPTLSLPADMQVAATGPNGATATFSASASDLVDGAVAVTCTPASGSTFAIGVTTVNCSATDAHGNVATGSFTIQVTYQLVGFYQPADPSPFAPTTIVWNTIKGGSVVPLKFEVFAGSTELTSTSIVQQPLKIVSIACTTGVEDLVEESLAAGTTSLRYDATAGQFIFNWQTPKKPGTCYKAYVSVLDGAGSAPNSTINAYFKIK